MRELQAVLNAVREAAPEQLPDLIGELESVKAAAWARLTLPQQTASAHDELLDVPTAAARLGISAKTLYARSDSLPFTRRMGRKLLFSAIGIDRYIRQNKA